MANKSKQKGTRAETKVVKALLEAGLRAERRPLKGSKDEGDVIVEDRYILEVKAGKQTANYSRKQKKEWMRQTKEERKNSGKHAYLIIVRYNRRLQDAEVWACDEHTFFWFDEFIGQLKLMKNMDDQMLY